MKTTKKMTIDKIIGKCSAERAWLEQIYLIGEEVTDVDISVSFTAIIEMLKQLDEDID